MHVIKFTFAHLLFFALLLLIIPNECTLLGFVKDVVTKTIDVDHTHSHSDSELNNFANIEDEFEDHGSRRCYKKLLIEEKVVYDTVDTCNHSYDKVMIYIF